MVWETFDFAVVNILSHGHAHTQHMPLWLVKLLYNTSCHMESHGNYLLCRLSDDDYDHFSERGHVKMHWKAQEGQPTSHLAVVGL